MFYPQEIAVESQEFKGTQNKGDLGWILVAMQDKVLPGIMHNAADMHLEASFDHPATSGITYQQSGKQHVCLRYRANGIPYRHFTDCCKEHRGGQNTYATHAARVLSAQQQRTLGRAASCGALPPMHPSGSAAPAHPATQTWAHK